MNNSFVCELSWNKSFIFLRIALGGPADLLQSPNLPLGVTTDGGHQEKVSSGKLCKTSKRQQ